MRLAWARLGGVFGMHGRRKKRVLLLLTVCIVVFYLVMGDRLEDERRGFVVGW